MDGVTKAFAALVTNENSEYAINVMPDIALVTTVLAVLAGFYVILCKWWCRCRRNQAEADATTLADATTQVDATTQADVTADAETNPAIIALNQQIAELRLDI